MSLGVNFSSLSKILKCAGNDDVMTMKAEDKGDSVSFMFENPSESKPFLTRRKFALVER